MYGGDFRPLYPNQINTAGQVFGECRIDKPNLDWDLQRNDIRVHAHIFLYKTREAADRALIRCKAWRLDPANRVGRLEGLSFSNYREYGLTKQEVEDIFLQDRLDKGLKNDDIQDWARNLWRITIDNFQFRGFDDSEQYEVRAVWVIDHDNRMACPRVIPEHFEDEVADENFTKDQMVASMITKGDHVVIDLPLGDNL